jgi:hypothetical protein
VGGRLGFDADGLRKGEGVLGLMVWLGWREEEESWLGQARLERRRLAGLVGKGKRRGPGPRKGKIEFPFIYQYL